MKNIFTEKTRQTSRFLKIFLVIAFGMISSFSFAYVGSTYMYHGSNPWNYTSWTTQRTGTMTSATNTPNITGQSTTFGTDVNAGDSLYAANGNLIGKVLSVTNSTHLVLTANALIAETTTSVFAAV